MNPFSIPDIRPDRFKKEANKNKSKKIENAYNKNQLLGEMLNESLAIGRYKINGSKTNKNKKYVSQEDELRKMIAEGRSKEVYEINLIPKSLKNLFNKKKSKKSEINNEPIFPKRKIF